MYMNVCVCVCVPVCLSVCLSVSVSVSLEADGTFGWHPACLEILLSVFNGQECIFVSKNICLIVVVFRNQQVEISQITKEFYLQ